MNLYIKTMLTEHDIIGNGGVRVLLIRLLYNKCSRLMYSVLIHC